MKKNKVLAICVPSYNAKPYIDRCINTFIDDTVINKIEVLIVNDGSKDNTLELAQKYAKMYPDSIKVIDKENGGHGSTINIALKNTKAKYFKVVDVDDWVDTKEFVKLVNFLETTDADIISNAYDMVNMVSGESEEVNNLDVIYGKKYNLEELDMINIYMSIHALTYKTKILQDNNIKLQEKTFYEDVEYQLLPMPYVKTIVFLQEKVYKYMVGNVNQSVNVSNFVNRYEDHNRVVRRIIEFLKTAKLNEPQREYIYNVFEKVLYTHYALSSIYDDNIIRGKERSISFDIFLKENNPYLYEFMGKKYSNIRNFRKHNFENIGKVNKGFLAYIKKIIKIIFGRM